MGIRFAFEGRSAVLLPLSEILKPPLEAIGGNNMVAVATESAVTIDIAIVFERDLFPNNLLDFFQCLVDIVTA